MSRRGIIIGGLVLLVGALVGAETVGDALGHVPWYDRGTDDWKRVVPRERGTTEESESLGGVSLFALAMYALIIAALALLLALIWKMRMPSVPTLTPRRRAAVQAGLADLPVALDVGDGDPEAGFRASCAAKDWRRAVIWLYAWQLLLLDGAGRLRLMAGKTNRAYLAEVAGDRTVSAALTATVAAFERTYFGREIMDEPAVQALAVQHRAVETVLQQAAGAR